MWAGVGDIGLASGEERWDYPVVREILQDAVLQCTRRMTAGNNIGEGMEVDW